MLPVYCLHGVETREKGRRKGFFFGRILFEVPRCYHSSTTCTSQMASAKRFHFDTRYFSKSVARFLPLLCHSQQTRKNVYLTSFGMTVRAYENTLCEVCLSLTKKGKSCEFSTTSATPEQKQPLIPINAYMLCRRRIKKTSVISKKTSKKLNVRVRERAGYDRSGLLDDVTLMLPIF